MTHGSCQSLLTKANEITRVLCLLAFHVIDTLPLAAILAQVASLEPNWLLPKFVFFGSKNVVWTGFKKTSGDPQSLYSGMDRVS
jgi:hypothetical protein